MGSSPDTPQPSQDELDAKAEQARLLKKQEADAALMAAKQKQAETDRIAAVASGKVGMNSVLTNGWIGFGRGGMGPA